MRSLIGGLGILGLFVGKYGALVSLVAWIIGLLGLITYVSFWWVSGFIALFFVSLVAVAGAAFAK